MTPERFVDDIYDHINSLVDQYSLGKDGPTYLGYYLDMLNIDNDEREKVIDLIRLAVGEAIHSFISGIEGKTPIGTAEQSKLHLITGAGNDIAGNLADLLVEKMEEDLPGQE